MKLWTSESGKSGMTMGETDLDATGKALLAACRKSYDANKADRTRLEAHLAKEGGAAVSIRFTFGGNFNVFPAKVKAAKTAPNTPTLAEYLKAQSA